VVGLPEAEYALTHAALYLALAPKSNSIAEAMSAARAAVEATPAAQVPPHLRSAVHAGQKALGDAVGYVYPHDRPGAVVEQQYLPDEARGLIVYRPKDQGDEAALAGSLRDIDSIANKPPRDRPD
jgi:putative ATPase